MPGPERTDADWKRLIAACRAAYCYILTQCPNVEFPEGHPIYDETYSVGCVLLTLLEAYERATGLKLPDPLPFTREGLAMSGATAGGPIRDAAEWAGIASQWVSALIQDELIPLVQQVRANGVDVTLPVFGGFTINIRAGGG